MSTIISYVLIVSGVIASPLVFTLNLVPVPASVPRWILIFGIPMIVLLVLAILAGIKLQFTLDSQHGRIEQALEILAELRKDGVQLWHEGKEVNELEQVNVWIDKIGEWQLKTTAQIKILSAVEARLFQTLRFYKAPIVMGILKTDAVQEKKSNFNKQYVYQYEDELTTTLDCHCYVIRI